MVGFVSLVEGCFFFGSWLSADVFVLVAVQERQGTLGGRRVGVVWDAEARPEKDGTLDCVPGARLAQPGLGTSSGAPLRGALGGKRSMLFNLRFCHVVVVWDAWTRGGFNADV